MLLCFCGGLSAGGKCRISCVVCVCVFSPPSHTADVRLVHPPTRHVGAASHCPLCGCALVCMRVPFTRSAFVVLSTPPLRRTQVMGLSHFHVASALCFSLHSSPAFRDVPRVAPLLFTVPTSFSSCSPPPVSFLHTPAFSRVRLFCVCMHVCVRACEASLIRTYLPT